MSGPPPSLKELADAEFRPPVPGPANLYEWPAPGIRAHEHDRRHRSEGIVRTPGK